MGFSSPSTGISRSSLPSPAALDFSAPRRYVLEETETEGKGYDEGEALASVRGNA